MIAFLLIFICGLYLFVTAYGAFKLKSSISGSGYFILFLIYSTVVQFWQAYESWHSKNSDYLEHFFMLGVLWLLLIQFEKWTGWNNKNLGAILTLGFLFESVTTPWNEGILTTTTMISIGIFFLSAQYILEFRKTTKNFYRVKIALCLGAYYLYDASSNIVMYFDEMNFLLWFNYPLCVMQLVGFFFAIKSAGE